MKTIKKYSLLKNTLPFRPHPYSGVGYEIQQLVAFGVIMEVVQNYGTVVCTTGGFSKKMPFPDLQDQSNEKGQGKDSLSETFAVLSVIFLILIGWINDETN